MSGGMLDIFPPGGVGEVNEEMFLGMVEEGLLEIADEGPPRRFRLTAAGEAHVEALFSRAGVTTDEAMAWMDERMSQ